MSQHVPSTLHGAAASSAPAQSSPPATQGSSSGASADDEGPLGAVAVQAQVGEMMKSCAKVQQLLAAMKRVR